MDTVYLPTRLLDEEVTETKQPNIRTVLINANL